MKQREKKNVNKKPQKPPMKVRSFTTPFENEKGVAGVYNAYLNNIGDDIFLSDNDPNGSYTGITRDGDNRPVQDVDDL